MPLKSPTALYSESISSKNFSYKLKKSIWASYNTTLYSSRGVLTPTSNETIQTKLREVQELCAWHESPQTFYFDCDRDLYQACLKQCEKLASTTALYEGNRENQGVEQQYLDELENLDTLANFAKDINQYNTLSRLLLVLGSILAIGYACAFPALAATAFVNALIFTACLSIFAPLGIVLAPIGLLSGLTTIGTSIVLCIAIGAAMNRSNPSPQGSKKLVEAMGSLREACLANCPCPTMSPVPVL